MSRVIKIYLTYLLSLPFLLSCKQPVSRKIEAPAIICGKAKLTGTLTIPDGIDRDSIFVNVTVPHQISGEFVKYKALVGRSGKFSFDPEVETTVTFIRLSTSLNPGKPLLVKLKSDAVTHLDLNLNSNHDIDNIKLTPALDKAAITRSYDLMGKMIEYPIVGKTKPLYDKSPDDFLSYSASQLSEILAIVKNDSAISKEIKTVLSDDFRLFYYRVAVFDYDKAMIANYFRSTGDPNKKPVIRNIDRSYFRFLKELRLNDSHFLYAFGSFFEFQEKLLENEVLKIPPINETEIPVWLGNVKSILSDLIGFKDGLYYDVLAANAYARQLNEQLRPLSEKQKKNISNYWKNGAIAKILLRKNQQVAELDKFKSSPVINDASTIAPEKVIQNIVARHRGKVILMDFWATWCSPCLEAMQRFRKTKTEFHDKKVVFVYLTNRSSPRKLWEEKIKGIGNQHYYLDDPQWKYVMKNFEFDAIPSYLLYSKDGKLVKKFTAFPENEDVKAMINELLK